MIGIDVTKIPDYLRSRRWFGGKAWPIRSVQVLDHALIGRDGHPSGQEAQYVLAVAEVLYELGTPERYLLALARSPSGELVEALDDDEFARGLLRIIREDIAFPTASGSLRGVTVDGAALAQISPQPHVGRISAEQTNTSLVFDEQVILKVIRRLDLGLNPEWELGTFLRKAGFGATPPLLGAVQLEGSVHTTVAVLHRFIQVESDGWTYVLELLRRGQEVLPQIERLGGCVADLHLALASDPEDPLFAPEPLRREDLQRWSSSFIGELGVTMAAAQEQVPELAGRRKALMEKIQRLAHVEPEGSKFRIHGDLHLGQTLRAQGEWLLFDFEGEPARSYEQRREKHTPLKDVAGMLRSLAYADAALELEGSTVHGRLESLRQAFLRGYLGKTQGAQFLPKTKETFEVLLDSLELEKLLYELRYEVGHRPDWVRIPARTLLAETP
jgi:maltokinase